ncbi:MAG: type II secretion system F family protein [Candidatus Pacearchaeota archaeon]
MKTDKIIRFVKINKQKIIAIVIALITAILSYIFLNGSDIFYFILGIAFVIASLPFIISLILAGDAERKKDEMFLEFARNLVESVKAGTPISKSILNIRNKDFGPLNPYVDKLANQISLGIPVKAALDTFARDIGSQTITRAVTIISESEKAGGRIEDILDSVAKSVSQVEILKKERRATMYNLVVQGYIIFMIFIVIILVLQFKVLPIAAQLGSADVEGANIPVSLGGFGGGNVASVEDLTRPFIYLLLVQGFFAGLVIGKLSEGKIKAGLKHSFVLIILAILISTGAKAFLS